MAERKRYFEAVREEEVLEARLPDRSNWLNLSSFHRIGQSYFWLWILEITMQELFS